MPKKSTSSSLPHKTSLPRKTPPHRSAKPNSSKGRNQRIRAIEALTVFGVNVTLASVAIVAVARLVPYNISQQQKLQTLQQEVIQANHRVQRLESDHQRFADPQARMEIAQEENNLIGANQRRVIWIPSQGQQPASPKP